MNSLSKQHLLQELYAPYIQCQQCPLAFLGRTNVVFARGNPNAKILLIGEAPGKDEDIQGKPFVGRSGKLLNEVLQALTLSPENDVYITNIVKCRPPNNRATLPIESITCKNLLLYNQIQIIKPHVICTLGATATNSLLDKELKITKVRGTHMKYGIITVIPTYHPAYILRNQSKLMTFTNDLELVLKLSQE
jgi:DNA polymerase